MDFADRAQMFVDLCKQYGVPVPMVESHRDTDLCDFTSPHYVRLNIPAADAEGVTAEHHVRHNFGHYLCGLHEAADNGKDVSIDCNAVADIIAGLLVKGLG